MTARAGRDISRKALLDAMKRRGILPETFDMEEDQEQLALEASQAPGGGDGLPAKKPSKTGLTDELPDEEQQTGPGGKQTSTKKQIPTSPDRPTPA
jgi:hypothetical protein